MDLAGVGPLVVALPLPGSEIAIILAIATLIAVRWNADVPSGELAWHELYEKERIVGGRLGGAVVYIAIIVISFLLKNWFTAAVQVQGVPPPPESTFPDPSYLLSDGVLALAAGLWEEISLFAVPIALLAIRNGHTGPKSLSTWAWGPGRFALILSVVTVLRAGIHLYLGWTALIVLPWMVGAVVLYRVMGSIWPLVIGHAAYDLVHFIGNRIPKFSGTANVMIWSMAVLGVVVIIASLVRHFLRRRQQVTTVSNSVTSEAAAE
jgi:hypothetical protein